MHLLSTHTTQYSLYSRRTVLQKIGLVGAALSTNAGPQAYAQALPSKSKGQGRLVVILLRGAYDGLSAFVPYTDRDYYSIRPNIAIAAPDGSTSTSIKLDDTFALHPALSPLVPLWKQGVFGFIPAAGLPAPNRSHFDAQYQIEIAQTGKTSSSPGWLNKIAVQITKDKKASEFGTHVLALGVGEANPAILGGSANVKLIPRGQAAERTGVLANDRNRQALLDLYAGNNKVSAAFRAGADSRMQSAHELATEKSLREGILRETKRMNANMDKSLDKDGTPNNVTAQNAQMLAANNGAADPIGLQLDALHLGTLMRNDRNLRIGFLSAGGWDTHANQGNATGSLANNLSNLALGITQLRKEFSAPEDVIVVISEFGRTSAENGTRGTDHGFGNALWLIGDRVAGGRWHGEWTGVAHGNLNEGRDLPAHHDYRAALAQILRSTFAMNDTTLSSLLPGSNWDTRLDGLMRKV